MNKIQIITILINYLDELVLLELCHQNNRKVGEKKKYEKEFLVKNAYSRVTDTGRWGGGGCCLKKKR